MSNLAAPFQLFDLEPGFNIDLQALEKVFLEKQLVWHPDRHLHSPEAQTKAEKHFAQLVKAYETLKNSSLRAKIMFQLADVWPLKQDAETLEMLLETQEQLMDGELSTSDVKDLCEKALVDLSKAFASNQLTEASVAYMRWRGLARLASGQPSAQQTFSPPKSPEAPTL